MKQYPYMCNSMKLQQVILILRNGTLKMEVVADAIRWDTYKTHSSSCWCRKFNKLVWMSTAPDDEIPSFEPDMNHVRKKNIVVSQW